MAVYNNYKSNPQSKAFDLSNPITNLDYRYGPYEADTVEDALDEAYEAIFDKYEEEIPLGLTIGVKIGDNITEYWFQDGTDRDNLVIKNNQIWN